MARDPVTRERPVGDGRVTAQGDAPALEMTGVFKRYGSISALHATSFRIEKGEFLTLLGPSGSGKTTILGLAAGIVDPDGGRIFFHGRDVTDVPTHERGVGMVFQRYTLFPNKTVAENVAFPLEVRKRPRREITERVRHFLDLVALSKEADRYPSQISGGQAQRVALARALVFEPELLLMDEPLGALDRRLRQTLQDEIRRIQKATQVPTLYVTHDQEEAMHLSDRIAVVRDGRIVALGGPSDVYETPASQWIGAFLGDINWRAVERFEPRPSGLAEVELSGIGLATARAGKTAERGRDLALIVRPERCRISRSQERRGNSFAATVVETTYLGPIRRVQLRVGENWTVWVTHPSHHALTNVQAQVFFEFDPDSALIVPVG